MIEFASDACYMEGHIYPDAESADPVARAHAGDPPSKCVRCEEINYSLRAYLAAQTRLQKKQHNQQADTESGKP